MDEEIRPQLPVGSSKHDTSSFGQNAHLPRRTFDLGKLPVFPGHSVLAWAQGEMASLMESKRPLQAAQLGTVRSPEDRG